MRLATESAADSLSTILPGTFRIERGTISDYRALAHFHYARGDPAAWAGIWRATYAGRSEISDFKSDPRVVAVAVLSYPVPAHRVRDRVLGLTGPRYGAKLAFVNAHIRTISRVIVHPQFRGLGLAAQLVRRVCDECPVRYVEAIAAMGEVHPFFERGGMVRMGEGYFLFDRSGGATEDTENTENTE